MPEDRLTAREAADLLGVRLETVYAYVARGIIRARHRSGRQSFFSRGEIEALAARGRPAQALLVRSAITTIEPDGPRYRGRSSTELAGHARFEDVSELLWTGELRQAGTWDASVDEAPSVVAAALPAAALPIDRLSVIVPAIGAGDPLRFHLSPERVAAAARELIASAVAALPVAGAGVPVAGAGVPVAGAGVAGRLWSRLSELEPSAEEIGLVNSALVLLADHELSPSTLAARIAASMGAPPHAVVGAGLAALQGVRHGAASLVLERLFDEIAGDEPRSVLGRWVRRGEALPGFGLRLYPGGDPRAATLLELIASHATDRARAGHLATVVAAAAELGLAPPNVDLALAGLAYAGRMRSGAGEAIFAVARMAGWIAHALEEYADPTPFRFRTAHTG